MQTETTEVHQENRKSFGTETTEQEAGVSITSHGVQTNDGRSGIEGLDAVSGVKNATTHVGADDRWSGDEAVLQNGAKSKGVAVGVDGFQDNDWLRDVATETDLEQLHKQVS